MKKVILVLMAFLYLSNSVLAATADAPDSATVQLPRSEYDRILLERLSLEGGSEQSPKYAFGEVTLTARIDDEENRIKGELTTSIQLEILREQYTTVGILPLGTKVKLAQADGRKIRLQATPEGLSFGGRKGKYQLTIVSTIDERSDGTARSIPLSLPGGSSAKLIADVSGTEISPAISPALSMEINSGDGRTVITAEIPEGNQTMLSWRRGRDVGFAASKGSFVGELIGEESVNWKGEIALEVFEREGGTYKLLPLGMTMSSVSVDGQEATVFEDSSWHAVRVKGLGKHKIQLEFVVPVPSAGAASFSFEAPRVPVSRYELKLAGKKTVKVGSGATVQTTVGSSSTIAVAHFPPSIPVSFSWTEEVPKEAEAASQINSAIYQTVIAEEGLIAVDALAVIEVARGEKTSLDFNLPLGIQINRVSGPSGVKTDWRVISQDTKQLLRVFFERGLKGEFSLGFSFDRPLGANAGAEVQIPVLSPVEVQRNKGMIVLLSSKDFSFDPAKETALTRVGENQIPAIWRKTIEKPVVHTFKYAGAEPALGAKLTVPEKIQGKLDAVVDTLISVGDVSIKGNAAIDVVLKSGKLNELELQLPAGLNILNVVAPSLRTHQITTEGEKQKIALQFTQDMEGTFLVQLTYERIFGEAGEDVLVPTVTVDGAEVEQGRVAVEALSAVEIQALKADRLSSLEPSELPKRLIMNTSNPILLGFKYFQADPPHELRLKVVRHKEVEPQSAVIDTAMYRTLITKDGVAITTADFLVRNSRKQFLKLTLPPHSEMWSATVDGKVEKPALEMDKPNSKESNVLVRLVNSTQLFNVQLVYKTAVQTLGYIGEVSSTLPKPDMIVGRSAWTISLPDDGYFGRVQTNMDIEQALTKGGIGIPKIDVPASQIPTLPKIEEGSHFALKRLYATEAREDSSFSVFYLSEGSYYFALIVMMLSVAAASGSFRLMSKNPATIVSAGGLIVATLVAHYLDISIWLPLLILIALKLIEKLAPLGRRVLQRQLDKQNDSEVILETQP